MSEKTKLFDDTAEQAILGAILYSAADCIDKVRLTGLKEDDFYKQVNRALYHSFLQMADDGMHIDRRIVKLSATPLRNRPHMVFCSQGTS